jgi:hypothetical protein
VTSISLPAAFEEFVALWNREQFWESHEALEAPWRQSRSVFFKGMILHASALVHAQRGNARGVLAQLRKAEVHLAPYRPFYLGIDVNTVLAHAERCRAVIGPDPDRASAGWAARIPPLRLHPEPHRIRGDEMELRDWS